MKFFKIVLLSIAIMLVSGCSIQENKTETTDIFEKNKECYKYKDGLEKEMKERNETNSVMSASFNEIFYSPSLKSCLYVRELSSVDATISSYDLIDILHNKSISSVGYVKFSVIDDQKRKNEFDKTVEVYKQ